MIDDDDYVPDAPQEPTRHCAKCSRDLPQSEFFKRGKQQKYYHSYCKECHNSPFEWDRIVCPHCRQKIMFTGLDMHNKAVREKENLLKEEIIEKVNKAKKKERIIKPKDLKSLFGED